MVSISEIVVPGRIWHVMYIAVHEFARPTVRGQRCLIQCVSLVEPSDLHNQSLL